MVQEKAKNLRWKRALLNTDLYVSVLLFSFIVAVTFLFVITRYLYSVSLPGLKEISIIVFIWFLYISMIYSMRNDAHIRVNIIDQYLNNKWKIITNIISNALLLLFNVLMVVFSGKLVFYNLGPYSAKSIIMGVPDYVTYAILPFSFAIFSWLTAANIYRDLDRLNNPNLNDDSLSQKDIESSINSNSGE